MDIRVLKARLTNLLECGYTDDYIVNEVKKLVIDLDREVESTNMSLDSGRVATVVDDLRYTYFALHDKYDSIPKTTKTLVKRSEVISDIISTITKITNYITWAMARISSSTDPTQRRLSSALKIELENFKGQLYSWNDILRTITEDKKIIVARMKGDN